MLSSSSLHVVKLPAGHLALLNEPKNVKLILIIASLDQFVATVPI